MRRPSRFRAQVRVQLVALLASAFGTWSSTAGAALVPQPDGELEAIACGEGGTHEKDTLPWGERFVSRWARRYPPRAEPARLAAPKDQVRLRQQGYADIGWLEVQRRAEKCSISGPCQAIQGPGLLELVQAEAARAGAELAIPFADPESESGRRETSHTEDGTFVSDIWKGTLYRRDPERSPTSALFPAIQRGDRREVERLLKSGARINAQEPRFCQTPLIYAASLSQCAKTADLLLSRKPGLEIRDGYGRTALGYAAFSEDCRCARLLRAAGAREPPPPVQHGNPIDFPPPRRCPR